MSDTDDYIIVTKKFEELRQEYLEWEAQAKHILKRLRQVKDVANADRCNVIDDGSVSPARRQVGS